MGRLPRLGDGGLALLAFACSLIAYLRTLYPGLNGIGDTPKFQFVGAVLGTPHPPGYPLYSLLGFLLSKLPFGNLAWRMNLLSALAAAAAVALLVLLLLRLQLSRAAAFAAALGCALGPLYWSQATLAEVYALAAAFVAALLLATVSWGRTRAPRRLDLAVLLAGLAMAHHTTVATLVPALVLYVLWTDRRAGLDPRFLARALGLVALGLLPYLYVLLRNLQGAPYLGARARTLPELWQVMRGASFEGRVFAFDVASMLGERSALVFGILRRELGLPGLALLALGLVVLWRRAPREALLLSLSFAGLVMFVLGYDVPDLDVFLVPGLVPLWGLAAAGLDAALRPARRALTPALAAALALALPASQAVLHFKASDHSGRTFEMRYFGALFEALPARAAIAAESYTVDHMVLYELLGEGAARGRDVITAPADPESVAAVARRGYTVFAFSRAAGALRPLGFRLVPVRLPDGTLGEYLASLPLQRLVMQAGRRADETVAALGTPGAPEALLRRGDDASLTVEAGDAVGPLRAPAALRAEAVDGGTLFVGGTRVIRSEQGLAFAVLGPGGRVLEAHDLDGPLRVPFDPRPFPLYRVAGLPECRDAGHGEWTDVLAAAASGRVLLRVDNHAAFEATATLWIFGERPFAPRLVAHEGHGRPETAIRTFGAGDPDLESARRGDGLYAGAPAAHAARVLLRVDDGGQFSAATLDLGGLPSAALLRARVDLPNPRRAQACAALLGDVDPEASELAIAFGSEARPFLGAGWHDAEPDGLRWTAAEEADVLLPLEAGAGWRLRLRAMPLAGAGEAPPQLELAIDGVALAMRPLRPGFGDYDFEVPASHLRAGTQRLTLRVARLRSAAALGLGDDTRPLGVAVSDLRVSRR
jgi:4-amino-4-deoxy-L-arabinose transferase-like glycosyltransferase